MVGRVELIGEHWIPHLSVHQIKFQIWRIVKPHDKERRCRVAQVRIFRQHHGEKYQLDAVHIAATVVEGRHCHAVGKGDHIPHAGFHVPSERGAEEEESATGFHV
jgi:hypothetical protein